MDPCAKPFLPIAIGIHEVGESRSDDHPRAKLGEDILAERMQSPADVSCEIRTGQVNGRTYETQCEQNACIDGIDDVTALSLQGIIDRLREENRRNLERFTIIDLLPTLRSILSDSSSSGMSARAPTTRDQSTQTSISREFHDETPIPSSLGHVAVQTSAAHYKRRIQTLDTVHQDQDAQTPDEHNMRSWNTRVDAPTATKLDTGPIKRAYLSSDRDHPFEADAASDMGGVTKEALPHTEEAVEPVTIMKHADSGVEVVAGADVSKPKEPINPVHDKIRPAESQPTPANSVRKPVETHSKGVDPFRGALEVARRRVELLK